MAASSSPGIQFADTASAWFYTTSDAHDHLAARLARFHQFMSSGVHFSFDKSRRGGYCHDPEETASRG